MKMLKTGQFANIADDITARKVIGGAFGSHGVCKFYLTTEPLLPGNHQAAPIFPVSLKYYYYTSDNEVFDQDSHFRRAVLTLVK